MDKYRFTSDWFSNNISRWEKHVVPYLKAQSQKGPIKCLEVGVFEGRSAFWTLENAGLLDNPESQIWLVDTWKRRSVKSAKPCWVNFLSNLRAFKRANPTIPDNKIMVCRGNIPDTLRDPKLLAERFDFVYLDINGDSRDLMETAALVWPLIKPGGMIVFDDYTSNREHDGACSKQGIDAFLDLYSHQLKVKHMSWQVMAVKRFRFLPRPHKCYSEFYEDEHIQKGEIPKH
jgi:predicted O-methyltransferase YrrM